MGRQAKLKRDRRNFRKQGVALPAGKDKRYLQSVKAKAGFQPTKKPGWNPISYVLDPPVTEGGTK